MNISHTSNQAEARSRGYQLLALAFIHPQPEFYAGIADGSYRRALADTLAALRHDGEAMAAPPIPFAEYESGYIAVFVAGPRGRPLVPLNAGEYETLRHGRSRPEQMLEYLRCYRHFGVRLNADAEANELPDHLSCQLELMAWLAHLEARTRDAALKLGYQRAQRDFGARLLRPMVREMGERLVRIGDAQAFFAGVIRFLALFVAATSNEINRLAEHDDTVTLSRVTGSTTEVELWD
jgi:DMSO reductase family type II enzyme chaperone